MKKTMFFLIAGLFIFIQGLHSWVVLNDVVPAFPSEERGLIEDSVVEGAYHYLLAKSHIALLLAQYEKSAKPDFNYSTALGHADKAAEELDASLKHFKSAIEMGKQAGYDQQNIEKFKTFNYDEFKENEAENQAFSETEIVQVKAYFAGGNILGAYQRNIDNITSVNVTLGLIRKDLAEGKMPRIKTIWKLLQQDSIATLFGNYCTVTAVGIIPR